MGLGLVRHGHITGALFSLNTARTRPEYSLICRAFKKDGDLPQGVDYVPMLFSLDDNHAKGWNETAAAAVAAGTTHLLGCVASPKHHIFSH